MRTCMNYSIETPHIRILNLSYCLYICIPFFAAEVNGCLCNSLVIFHAEP